MKTKTIRLIGKGKKLYVDRIKGINLSIKSEMVSELLSFTDEASFDSKDALDAISNCVVILEEMRKVIEEESSKH